MSATTEVNDQLVLISGFSGEGKSASLRNIKNQERWMYLNTEAGKRLPFRNSFQSYRITDPYQVHEAFDYAAANMDKFDGIILDSLTFLMDMFETNYVLYAVDTQKAWGDFQQFFKILMQKVTHFNKPVIITAHLKDELDQKAMEMKTFVPIKGALKNNGIEAYFSTVLCAKKVDVTVLAEYKNPLLTITEEEQLLGYKHVFQTKPTKTSVGLRIRSPMGMFDKEHTYIDNDAQTVIDYLTSYYN